MQRRSNFFPIVIIFLILSFLIYRFSGSSLVLDAKGIVEKLLLPVRTGIFSWTGKSRSESSQISKLKKENGALLVKLSKYRLLEQENNALRDQFQTTSVKSQSIIPANIIGAPAFVPGVSKPGKFILDKGARDGVKLQQAVVLRDQFVGQITSVSEYASIVSLITQEGISLTAKVVACPACEQSSAQILGVLKGKGAEQMVIENVLLSEKLHEKDFVMTRGDGDSDTKTIIPKDLVIGKIMSVNKKPSELFQSADVQSLIDFASIASVFVVVGH